ncbi:4865_t:CDS:2 [Paraglomus brasilianum]|uniref:4865_t:CDS:1 n=1 Tax=Paraglomus brasilianum TaxID=144538 RepID=A0A9N9AWA2_9GLOM|nr:4865_t:CDS:2 [Paraglomus brasilianum]
MAKIARQRNNRERFLGVFSGLGNNVNNMIGAGIYSSPGKEKSFGYFGTVWRNVGSPWIALLLWLLGGIASFAGTLTYTELGAQFQIGAGETTYLEHSFPRPRLLLSYSFTMVYIILIRPAGISAVVNVCAQYLLFTLGLNGKGCELYEEFHPLYFNGRNFWRLKLTTVAILAVIALYHSLSNKWSNRINQALVTTKVLTVLTVVVLGLSFAKASAERVNSKNVNWDMFSPASPDFYQNVSATEWIQRYITAMLTILFAYAGWNNLNYLTEEFDRGESSRNLLISNAGAVGIVTVLYLLANLAYTAVLNVATVIGTKGTDPNEIIGVYFAAQIDQGDVDIVGSNVTLAKIKAARALSFFIALSAFGAAAVLMQSASRVVDLAGQHNYVPFISGWLSTWNDRLGTPVNSFISLFVWCSILTMIVPGNSSFEFLVKIEQYTMYFFFLLAAIGALVLRRRNRQQERRTYRAPLIIIILFILFASIIVALSWVPPKSGSAPPTNSTTSLTDSTTSPTPNIACSKSKPVNTYAVYGTSLGVLILTGVLWRLMRGRFTEESETETENGHGPRV